MVLEVKCMDWLGVPCSTWTESRRGGVPQRELRLLLEARRMDAGQDKQQMSPSVADPFGQIKSYWETRHANQIKNGAATGLPACRRIHCG